MSKEITIPDLKTGEERNIEIYSDDEISEVLTKVNYKKKIYEKLEIKIKDYIKKKRLKEDQEMFGNHKVVNYITYKFDKKLFEETATDKDKKVYEKWKKIQENYVRPNSTIMLK